MKKQKIKSRKPKKPEKPEKPKKFDLLSDIFEAYFCARRNKINSKSQLEFEVEYEKRLSELYDAIISRKYRPKKCYCFVITKPVKREVFASFFVDRVVHHLLFNYIAPVFERQMIFDSYSCRVGKGTLRGIKRLTHHIRSCTANYTKPGYILKLDLSGYFMSIDKELLFKILKRTLDKLRAGNWPLGAYKFDVDLVEFLIKRILFRSPASDCIRLGKLSDWDGLPPSKSLLKAPEGHGLPIGDLTSQLFSNIFMNEFDQYAKRELKCKHYGRYVDDFYIVDNSKEHLKELIPVISTFLKDKLHLTLHPKKIALEHASRGIQFIGSFVKPFYRLPTKRVIASFIKRLKKYEALCSAAEPLKEDEILLMRSVLNSYAGYFRKFASARFVARCIERAPSLSKYLIYDPSHRKFCILKTCGYN